MLYILLKILIFFPECLHTVIFIDKSSEGTTLVAFFLLMLLHMKMDQD